MISEIDSPSTKRNPVIRQIIMEANAVKKIIHHRNQIFSTIYLQYYTKAFHCLRGLVPEQHRFVPP